MQVKYYSLLAVMVKSKKLENILNYITYMAKYCIIIIRNMITIKIKIVNFSCHVW